jgi:hypothetical protein
MDSIPRTLGVESGKLIIRPLNGEELCERTAFSVWKLQDEADAF